MVVSIVQATRIKARIRVRNRQKAALRISRAARLYLGSKNLTSLRHLQIMESQLTTLPKTISGQEHPHHLQRGSASHLHDQ